MIARIRKTATQDEIAPELTALNTFPGMKRQSAQETPTLGVIIGNRDFFPDVLVGEARRDLLKLFGELDIDAVLLDEQATKLGAVETWNHAKRCADLFRANRDRIHGVVVSLPNFGDEKGVADTLKLADLNV